MIDLNLSWFLGVLHDLRSTREPYTVIHAHGSGVYWPLLAGILASRQLRVPLVLTIHCSLHATYHAMSLLDAALLPFSRWIEKTAICHSARSVVLTERSLATYRQLALVEPSRFVAIPDCIEVAQFNAHATPEKVRSFREHYRLPADRPIVAFVGRVAHEKGWRHLVTLAQLLRDERIHFLVCGDGNERDALEKELEKNALQERFTITGFVPAEVVPLAFSVCSLMVLPSLHEEFGGAMIEAMAMAKPVVAFEVGGVSEVLQGGCAGRLVPFGDVAAMKNAVLELISRPDLRESLATAGKMHVMQRYQIDEVCSRLMSIYQEVTARP
jgi:2-deoxystreptamine N-acetyl-D-glucosaminyltransferase/2-deoxystreptamine glucosyltransferase